MICSDLCSEINGLILVSSRSVPVTFPWKQTCLVSINEEKMGGETSKKVVGVGEQKQVMAQEAEVTGHHKPD